MRIALVILHADRSRGGAETYTLDLASALARRGHDVSLLASTYGEPNPGVTEIPLDVRGATRAGRYRVFLDSLEDHLNTSRYDVVHAMLPVLRCDVYHPHAGIAAAGLSCWTVHFNPRRRAMAKVERQLLTRAGGPTVLCLSDYVKGFVRQHYPLPGARLVRLFNAVDLERFIPRSTGGPPVSEAQGAVEQQATRAGRPRHETVTGLMIAQDFERKGLRQTIEAIARANDPRLRLTVVGKGEVAPFARLADSRGIRDRIDFTGPTSDPAAFYREADFFVLPTRHDPCSLVVLESLAMGVPVVSTTSNGATEIMTDGVHGFILPDPGDVDALADRLRRLLDPGLRQDMRNACLALRPALSYEHHLNQLEDIYRGIQKSPSTNGREAE